MAACTLKPKKHAEVFEVRFKESTALKLRSKVTWKRQVQVGLELFDVFPHFPNSNLAVNKIKQ